MNRLHVATDNYFRVGRRVWFFGSKDALSATRAWNQAALYQAQQTPQLPAAPNGHSGGGKLALPPPIAVYRPFRMPGPWRDAADVIGFMPAGQKPDVVDDPDGYAIEAWAGRVALRKLLWETGAWHVDGMGVPIA